MSNNISVTEAIQRAGRVIYSDCWIAGLTPDERDAMAQYPVGGPEPVDSEACVVVARARDRDGRAKLQHDRARRWLKSCGFSTGAGAHVSTGKPSRPPWRASSGQANPRPLCHSPLC
jgi:hypothetical protein